LFNWDGPQLAWGSCCGGIFYFNPFVVAVKKILNSTMNSYYGRKVSAIIASLSFFLYPAFGQPNLGFTEAMIIKKTGDTMNCFVEIAPGYEDIVIYRLNKDGQGLTMKAKEIQTIITAYQIYESIPLGKNKKLMALIADGPVKLYKYIIIFNGNAGPAGTINLFGKPDITYVIKKTDNYYEINEKGYNSSLMDVLKDCDQVVKKIESDNYKFMELEQAVKDYNNCNKPQLITRQGENDMRFLGTWKSDMKDEVTKNNLGETTMTFYNEGKLIYETKLSYSRNSLKTELIYRTIGDSLISDKPSHAEERISIYKFENDDKLILEIQGVRCVFLRRKKG